MQRPVRFFPWLLTLCLVLPPATILLVDVIHHQSALALDLLAISLKSAFFLLSVLGWGALVLRFFRTNGESQARILMEFVCGIGFLYLTSILLALVGLFRPIPLLVVFSLGMLPGFARWFFFPSLKFHEWNVWQRSLFLLILLIAGIRIVCGWTPLISYDSLVYQFYTPAQYLNYGRFIYIPWNVYTNSPMALQMTLGTSLALDASGETNKLLVTITSILMSAVAALFTSRAGRSAGLLAALFVLAYPAFWVPDTLGTIDLTAATFLVLGAYYLQQALSGPAARIRIFLAGLCLGLALASRYQAIFTVLLILVILFLESRFKKAVGLSTSIRIMVQTAGWILVIIFPWLIKNWIYNGNPVFPALFETLGGSQWSSDQNRRLSFDVFGPSLLQFSGADRFTAPLRLLFAQPDNAFLGAALFVGVLAALVFSKHGFRAVAWIGLLGTICWGVLHPVADVRLFRFNAAGIAFLMIATAGILSVRFKKPGLLAGNVLAFASLPVCFIALAHVYPVYSTVTGIEFRTNFQQANVPGWKVIQEANRLLNPKRDKLLLIGETRAFLLKIPCIAPSGFNSPQLVSLFQPSNAEERWLQNLEQLGVSHILISIPEWKHLQAKQYYGYMNLPRQDQIQIVRWLQKQKVIYEDRSGNALLQIKYGSQLSQAGGRDE